MDYVIICTVAFLASALTLFSGFGLGTILLPAFALFFPTEVAVALTGVVHFLNNIFKLLLVGRKANRQIVIRFGIPAILFAFAGAWLLGRLSLATPLLVYGAQHFAIYPVKLVIGVLLIFFALFDIVPGLYKLQFPQKYLPLGGALSGFFGGISGNQGALRSAFLIKAGLDKETYIATGVVIACLIDVTRLGVYGSQLHHTGASLPLMTAATFCAFAGAFVGNRLMKKITVRFVQYLVALLLITIGSLMSLGII